MKKIMFACVPFVLLLCACTLENGNVIGPAGGYVFYDKGNYNDGWRYLEASPKDAGEAQWSDRYYDINGTSAAMGSGKQNTDLILAAVKAKGENNTAAQLCEQFSYGGYTDWFLPSEEELKQMMKTAKRLFESTRYPDTYYWTSTEYSDSVAKCVYRDYYNEEITSDSEYKSRSNKVRPARRF